MPPSRSASTATPTAPVDTTTRMVPSRTEAAFLTRRLLKGVRELARPAFWSDPRVNPHSDVAVFERRRDAAAFRLDVLAMNTLDRSFLRERWTRAMDEQDRGVGAIVPVPEVELADWNPRLHRHQPVVIRGLAKRDPTFRPWDFDAFVDTYGDDEVLLSCPVRDGYTGRLREIDIPGVYVQNSEVLLIRHPELLLRAAFPNLLQTVAANKSFIGIAQLFVGRKNTGTWWHCAGRSNFFTQLAGRKRWRFIDPGQAPRLFPITEGAGRSTFYRSTNPEASPTRRKMAAVLQEELHATPAMRRAMERCTIQQVDLEPGDVLLSPDWWWHDVENLTDASIGMAARFLTGPRSRRCVFDVARSLNVTHALERLHDTPAALVRPDGTLDLQAHGREKARIETQTRAMNPEVPGDVAAYYARMQSS